MSTYIGLYVQRLKLGEIYSVQVKGPCGISSTLTPDTYTQRCIDPPIDQLPDLEKYDGDTN